MEKLQKIINALIRDPEIIYDHSEALNDLVSSQIPEMRKPKKVTLGLSRLAETKSELSSALGFEKVKKYSKFLLACGIINQDDLGVRFDAQIIEAKIKSVFPMTPDGVATQLSASDLREGIRDRPYPADENTNVAQTTAPEYLNDENQQQSKSGLLQIFERADEIASSSLKGRPTTGEIHPKKSAVRARIEDDVIEWLKSKNPEYTSQINAYLRALKEAEEALNDPRI